MKLRMVYLALSILGFVLPISQFIFFVQESGFRIALFFEQLFATRVSAFFAWDVIVAAIVLVLFIVIEAKRLRIKAFWLPIIATFAVGVSLGLPLFLYMRQGKLDRMKKQ